MDYEKLFKQAKAYATRAGLGDDAEDFAQWVTLKQFRNGVITSFKNLYCDYRDFCRADKRILSSPQGQLSGFRTISLDAPLDGEESNSPKLGDLIGVPGTDVASGSSDELIELLQRSFTGRDREVLDALLDGHTMKEIGCLLAISESRVSQVTKRISELAMVYRILPKGTQQWVGEYAFKGGKRRLDVLKKRILEQDYRRKLICLREDGEISLNEHLQETQRLKPS